MAVSWSRTAVRRKWPSSAAMSAAAVDVQTRYGAWATAEIKRRIWAYGRFVYKNVRPKPMRSKSSEAWAYRVEKWGTSEAALIVSDPATNRYGTNYPKYVHLSGRPKSDKLMNEVHDFMEQVVAPKVGEAMAMAYERLAVSAGVTKTSTTWGG